jgi:hypothetical protein
MLAAVSGFTRYLGESIFERRREDAGALVDAPVMFSVWFNAPPERVEEFDAWYNQEHIPLLLEHRDWLGSRRFRITGGEPDPHGAGSCCTTWPTRGRSRAACSSARARRHGEDACRRSRGSPRDTACSSGTGRDSTGSADPRMPGTARSPGPSA